jgi:hypothetical protein
MDVKIIVNLRLRDFRLVGKNAHECKKGMEKTTDEVKQFYKFQVEI